MGRVHICRPGSGYQVLCVSVGLLICNQTRLHLCPPVGIKPKRKAGAGSNIEKKKKKAENPSSAAVSWRMQNDGDELMSTIMFEFPEQYSQKHLYSN